MRRTLRTNQIDDPIHVMRQHAHAAVIKGIEYPVGKSGMPEGRFDPPTF